MPDPLESAWLSRAKAFRADDPDPDTQAELDALLAAPSGSMHELRDRFATRLAFGTAGLRGLLGAGDNRMNRRVVALTTAALCAHLAESVPDARQRGLCVGFDGRHKSREFADEVAQIAAGAGFVVHAFEAPAPTPLLAFATLQRAAAGGVMITASHNPAAYNGYKVYLADGAQLREPHDTAITQHMNALGSGRVIEFPRLQLTAARAVGLWHALTDVQRRYLEALQSQWSGRASASTLRVAYTAMHGVGEPAARAALQLSGVRTLDSVAEQARPDPDFPTVAFPNPEEPGALDRLLALANKTAADLAIANDPDADRLALAVRAPDGLQTLSGNEVGVLLADYLLAQAPRDGRNLIVSTIVSTPLATRIAHAHNARMEITLTGFKWIMHRALDLIARENLRFVLGFEEALGYCIGDLVRDKDGIAAAAHVVRMAEWHAAQGRTLYEALAALYRRHGLFESQQLSIAVEGDAARSHIDACLARLRADPPRTIAGHAVTRVTDLLQTDTESALPKTDLLSFELDGAHRITVRPSGTEPKLKIYLDGSTPFEVDETLAVAKARARALCTRIGETFASEAGLK